VPGALRTMIDMEATVLCCTPTYAIRLAEVAAEEEIDLGAAKVRTIIVAGEPGGSVQGTRRHISELWGGAQVVDQHGMTEIGPVSYGCPQQPGVLHVIESSYIAEVVDPESGRPVARGAPGGTGADEFGTSGIAAAALSHGDIVQAAAEDGCACGSDDRALNGGILGRTDDMLVVRGVNVYPSAMDDVLRSCGGVAEYRVARAEQPRDGRITHRGGADAGARGRSAVQASAGDGAGECVRPARTGGTGTERQPAAVRDEGQPLGAVVDPSACVQIHRLMRAALNQSLRDELPVLR